MIPNQQALHARVKELYLEGRSYSQIAEICFKAGLSRNITKGSVAGLINRMGVSSGKKPRPPPGRPKPSFQPRSTPDPTLHGVPPLPRTMSRIEVSRNAKVLTLHELCGSTCRWPVCEDATCDVAGKIYCGAPISPKSSYCPGHTRLSLA